MFALDEKRPGLVRVSDGGASLDLEIWRVPEMEVGSFLAGIPSPLGLGRVELEGGGHVCGFLCEHVSATGKPDITSHGGWRAWLEVRNS
jgi:allophanate hydrolase